MSESFVDKLRNRIPRLQKQKLDSFAEFKTVIAEEETQTSRYACCKACNEYKNEQCSITGCYTEIVIRIPDFRCPVNKW